MNRRAVKKVLNGVSLEGYRYALFTNSIVIQEIESNDGGISIEYKDIVKLRMTENSHCLCLDFTCNGELRMVGYYVN